MGVIVAGLAIPFAGVLGVGARQVAQAMDNLPSELETDPLPQKTKLLDSDGETIATLYDENRVNVSLDQISRKMIEAIISIEDARFYEHGALDLKGTLRALLQNQSAGSVQQGGSNITQQYVKISLVEKAKTPEEVAAATADNYQRKVAELRYAIAVEKQYSKQEILEKYLNLANFGDGAWGIQAAAQHYFSVNASQLTLPQAAMLAGLVKNPTGYDPTNNAKRAKDRRDVVIKRMLELHVISVPQANSALKTPVINPAKVRSNKLGCGNGPYPFYCEYVVSELENNAAFGKTKTDRANYLKTAGLTIRTSLDPKIQADAQRSIDTHSKPTDQAIAAITIVEPGTGLVKAMAQSRGYGSKRGQTAYNYNAPKTYPGGYGGFQNGSTMKAFTIAAAIQKGIPLTYKINSPSPLNMGGMKYTDCNGTHKVDDGYSPKNSTSNVPDPTMVEAAQKSTNTYFLQLSLRTGLCPIAKIAASLGMYNAQDLHPLQQVPSMTLGIDPISPVQLAGAYAAFAARGMYCNPWVVTSVKDAAGKPVSTRGADCKQALAPEVADGVNAVLHQVMEPNGTGGRLKFGKSDLAGKTGTINEAKAVWYAGYSTRLAAAATVADASLPYKPLQGQTLNGHGIDDPTGSGTAGPIWEAAMKAALQGYPTTHFVAPSDKIQRGDVKSLPFVNGMNPDDAANKLRQAGFDVAIASGTVNSEETAGTVAYTDPRQRDGAPEGSLVTIYVSNGNNKNQPNKPQNTTKPPGGPTTINPNCPPWNPKYPNCGGHGHR
jgi:membrane peptidoglycan carboxypeptidase